MFTHTVPCRSALKDAIDSIASDRGTTVSLVLKNLLTVLDPVTIANLPDPGEPTDADVWTHNVLLSNGRMRRVRVIPKLRIRFPVRLDPGTVRKAAWTVVALTQRTSLTLTTVQQTQALEQEINRQRVRLEQFAAALETLAFRLQRNPIRNAAQAAYILGFAHEWGLDAPTVNSRFRSLAPIFHPDTGLISSADRMSQLVEARNFLLEHLKS
ncbi:MAG: hypothetical protein P4M00_24475 [Azospirillaceae bacterium]|nr:hypothetical protein [Azospirillaceae bacterium]